MQPKKLILFLFCLLTGTTAIFAQQQSDEEPKKKCEMFARITVNAAVKYAEENTDFLAKWIGETLDEETVKRGTEKLLTESCEIAVEYSSLYVDLVFEGWTDEIDDFHAAIEKLKNQDSDNVIQLQKVD